MPKGKPGRASCAVDGCNKPNAARGWCEMHYARWRRRQGDVAAVQHRGSNTRPAHERVLERVDRSSDCWTYTGPLHGGGYGQVRVGKVHGEQRFVQVHRAVYEALVGPIPEGLELDHLCFNRACVRPEHLEPVTPAENVRRASARKPVPEACGKGHLFTEANTYYWRGLRICRTCDRARHATLILRLVGQ